MWFSRVGKCAVQACAGRVDLQLTVPADFQPATLDLPADGRRKGKARRAPAPLSAASAGPGTRGVRPGRCSPRILASASGLGETVGCRLAGCMAAIVPRDARVDGRARSSHLHRPFSPGRAGAPYWTTDRTATA